MSPYAQKGEIPLRADADSNETESTLLVRKNITGRNRHERFYGGLEAHIGKNNYGGGGNVDGRAASMTGTARVEPQTQFLSSIGPRPYPGGTS